MSEIGFNALKRPLTPTERLERVNRERDEKSENNAIGGTASPETPWYGRQSWVDLKRGKDKAK